LSFYFPKKILLRVRKVLDNYPPSKYPKLYNKSADYYEFGATIYKVANNIILVIGFILIIAIGYWDFYSDEALEAVFSFFYFMLQMIPIIMMEISGYSYFKKMRKENKQSKRKALIRPRHLFDFVSKKMVFLALTTNIGAVLFIYYLDHFQAFVGSDTFVIGITLLFSNILFAAIIRFNINGQKQDPYQSTDDRTKQITVTIKTIVGISIVASVFIIVNQAMDHFQLDALRTISLSIYLQLIAWLSIGNIIRSLRIEDINFDVYRKDSTAA